MGNLSVGAKFSRSIAQSLRKLSYNCPVRSGTMKPTERTAKSKANENKRMTSSQLTATNNHLQSQYLMKGTYSCCTRLTSPWTNSNNVWKRYACMCLTLRLAASGCGLSPSTTPVSSIAGSASNRLSVTIQLAPSRSVTGASHGPAESGRAE